MNTEERLAALKDSKRVVELKYQNVLMEKPGFESKIRALNQSNELMQVLHSSKLPLNYLKKIHIQHRCCKNRRKKEKSMKAKVRKTQYFLLSFWN